MSSRKNKEIFEAVCFFGKKSIVKEMRYSEFEAVLDGVVGITELANKEVDAAYIKITSGLKVHSLVTFQIEFNHQGFADEDWNIPLRHLAENAGPGPDLGAGPIRLACRSQCSVSWYQRELWEPNQREINHFQLLMDAVSRNKLGLIADEEIPMVTAAPPVMNQTVDVPVMSETVNVPVLDKGVNQSLLKSKLEEQAAGFQEKVDLLISRQKLNLQSLEEKYRDEIDQVKRAMRNETQSYRHKAQELEHQANHNKVLLEKLHSRNTKLEREQIQINDQNESLQDQYDQLKDEYLELLRNQRSAEDDKSQQINELKEELTEKSIELDDVLDEVTLLKADKTELTEKIEGYQVQAVEQNSSNSSEISELSVRLERKQNEAAELKAKITTLSSEKERMEQQLSLFKGKASSTEGQVSSLEVKNVQLQESLKKAEFQAQEIARKAQKLESKNEKLAQELADVEEAEANNSEIFDQMEHLELVFVAYHPGVGHISLPARQLEDYLQKPMAFAAQKCGVTLEHYKMWLAHYDNPVCEECNVPIKRIDAPSEFQPGTQNRCSKHRIDSGNIAMFRKSS